MSKKEKKEEDILEEKAFDKEVEEELKQEMPEKTPEAERQEEENKIAEDRSGKKEVESPEDLAANYLDGWKRCQADFENYKKRQAESSKDMMRYANEGLILQIIPVIDNFQASTAHVPEDQKENPWVTGIMYIQKQLEGILFEQGVSVIEANVGDNFDPAIHEAFKGDSNDTNEHPNDSNVLKIKKVVARGYELGERVIRPARVIVE